MLDDSLPTFSVVIPTRDRPATAMEAVKELASCGYPAALYELILVDDGSEVASGSGVEPLEMSAIKGGPGVKIVRQSRRGAAAARNRGAEAASGEFLVFLDDDCRPESDFLARLAARFHAQESSAIGIRVQCGRPENLFSLASHLVTDRFVEARASAHGRSSFCASNALAVRRRDFLAMGGFDASFARAGGEDRDFSRRWIESGRTMVLAPEITVVHDHPLRFGSFLRKHFDYGRGAMTYRRRGGVPSRRPPGSRWTFYRHLFARAFSECRTLRALELATLLSLTQAATLGGLIWEALRPSRDASATSRLDARAG